MKLQEKEAVVLAAVVASNSLSIELLAKLTGFKYHTVRYNLSLLTEKKVLFKSILFNPSLLGLQWINIFFSMPLARKQIVLNFLKAHPLVSWLAENSGDSPYEMTCLVQHVGEVESLLQEVSDRFGVHLDRKELTVETELYFYGYKYLSKGKLKPSQVTIGWSTERYSCDEEDVKIMSALRSSQHNNDAEIAHSLGIPHSTLVYRIKKLRSKNVIAADLVYIDPVALGLLEVQILITLRSLNAEQIKKFRDYVQKYPIVVAVIRGIGFWDFKLVVQVQSYTELFDLQDNLRVLFPDLIKSLNLVPRRKLYQIAPVFEFPTNPDFLRARKI